MIMVGVVEGIGGMGMMIVQTMTGGVVVGMRMKLQSTMEEGNVEGKGCGNLKEQGVWHHLDFIFCFQG